MKFLNNLAIKSKLIFIVLFSTAIILLLSFVVLRELYDKKNSAQRVLQGIKVALILANTIDSLQIERGLSVGFLNSKSSSIDNFLTGFVTYIVGGGNGRVFLKSPCSSF